MAYVAPEGHDCMGCKTDSNGRPGLPCELCQSRSPTDGIALLFDACLSPTLAPHPLLPPNPIDAIHDITAIEKKLLKKLVVFK